MALRNNCLEQALFYSTLLCSITETIFPGTKVAVPKVFVKTDEVTELLKNKLGMAEAGESQTA